MNNLLTTCAVSAVFFAVSGVAQAAVINVPDDFPSIQAAIDAAGAGDTIYVSRGTYYENVNVNKQLNIYSTDGPSVTTVVASDPKDDVFEVTSNNVAIDGFTVTGAERGFHIGYPDIGYAGIFLNNVRNCNVSNNTTTSNGAGIFLYRSLYNTVGNNNANSNHDDGVNLYLSSCNRVDGNISNLNGGPGILVQWFSYDNILENNIANSNRSGIHIGNSAYTTLRNNRMANNVTNFGVIGYAFPSVWRDQWTHWVDTSNTVDDKPIYYLMDAQGQIIDSSTNAGFVACIFCKDITVRDLDLSNNTTGVLFLKTHNSVIQSNTISNNSYCGIALWHSTNDIVYHNNIIDNPRYQAQQDGECENNYWYHSTLLEGNYWSDYPGVDDGGGTGKHAIAGDGIGDTDIPWHYDYYPLINPWVTTITVVIDIKPGSYPNAINLGSYGLVPVAIFSDGEFDATSVDPETVELAGAGVAVRGKANKYMAHSEDVNGDGLLDLVVQVATENLDAGSLQAGYAILTGKTYDGVPIEGKDEITIVPPEK